jgi:hypothetical protein
MTGRTASARLLAALLALAGASSCRRATPPAEPPAAPPARGAEVWPGLVEGTPDDLALAWRAPWLNGTFVLKEGRLPDRADRRLLSCADLDGIQADDVQLGPAWERYNFTEKSIRCRALALTRRAAAAPVGYLDDVVSSNDPGDVLPAALAPAARPTANQSGSWRSVDPSVTFDRAAARADHRELVVGGTYRGRMTWWASGDFNGDRIADALVFLNLARTSNPDAPNIMRAFVLTRRQPHGPVTILQQISP